MSIFDSDASCGLSRKDYDTYYFNAPHKDALDNAMGTVLPESTIGEDVLRRAGIFMEKLKKEKGLTETEVLDLLVFAIQHGDK